MSETDLEITGAPPTLEWIGVDQLAIDPTYQRAAETKTSIRLIASIVKSWDWRLCMPLSVSRRKDGMLLVVDGQHRLRAARKRGDIPHLPCVVSAHTDPADEAKTFVALNLKRQKLSQGDVFRASLATGDPEARETLEMIERTGFSLAPHSNWTAWKPLQIFCAPQITKSRRQYGDKIVEQALAALARAYPDVPLRYAGTMLPALYAVFKGRARLDDFDLDRFVTLLGSIEQEGWLDEASGIRVQHQVSRREALILAFSIEYDAAVREDALA